MYKEILKPVSDKLLAVLLLIILLGPLLLIALLLFLNFNKTPLFVQQRVGNREKLFYILKFRTMADLSDNEGKLLSDDQRTTVLGRLLRKTGIDELPQLLNILKGDMSFIGPRPLLPEYLPLYTAEIKKRHNVKPGITGLAQIHGGNSVEWEKRFQYDLQYIENISLLSDGMIMVKTIYSMFTRRYQQNIGPYCPETVL